MRFKTFILVMCAVIASSVALHASYDGFLYAPPVSVLMNATGSSGAATFTTQTTAFDALSPLTTKGDTLVYSGTHSVRFAACADGDQIQFDSSQVDGIKCVVPASGSGTVTVVTGTSPIVITSTATTTPNVTINQAATAASGYLSAADWNTFNGKQAALTFGNITDAGTDGITVTNGTNATVGPATSLSQHVADATHNGYLAQADWSTFNGKGSGTVTAVSVASAHGFSGSSSGGATPALTITPSGCNGICKSDATTLSTATSGTDYAPATSGSAVLKGNGSGGFSNATDADITAFLLTGFSAGYGVVAATDSILQSIQKIVGNFVNFKETVQAGGTCNTTYTVDPTLGSMVNITINGFACNFAVTNLAAGHSFSIKITQGATPFAPTFSSAYKWPAGTQPTWSSTNGLIDIVACESLDGTTLQCNGLVNEQ